MRTVMLEELEKVALFQDLSEEQLEEVGSFCTLLNLQDGEILIHESDAANTDIYILCEGRVEIVSSATPLISGEVVISREDKNIFGEMAWLSDAPRTASVRCHGPVQAIRVDGEALKQFLSSRAGVAYPVMRRIALILAERMRETDSLLKQILWNTTL
jgi:CRP/FNR family cyclic AMP-dependent transcriptional regulator